MRKVPLELENDTNNSFTFSMHVSDYKFAELWNLDTLGILEPFEKETKSNLQQ